MRVQQQISERGYSMPWWAMVLAFVAVPLFSLAVDITRGMYVRTRLQEAVDAACEAGAQGLDVPHFRDTGNWHLDPGLAHSFAAVAFRQSVTDQGIVGYAPSYSMQVSATFTDCQGVATVSRLIPFTPPIQAVVLSVSEMRVGYK